MKLARPSQQPAPISLVSMIDVLMIMLVFFMVTSTYLDLRMIPMAEQSDEPAPSPAAATPGATLLIRLAPDGIARIQGKPHTAPELASLLRTRLAQDPATSVIVLPSGMADAQGLVSLLDTATGAGVSHLRILRLEARP